MLKNDPKNSVITDDKLTGIYRGVIENNDDPKKLGRCKIRIWGVHTKLKQKTKTEGITTEELPWASPALSLFEGSVTGFGNFVVPLQGAHVYLFFEYGHPLHPVYFSSIPNIPTDQFHGFKPHPVEGFSDPDKIYPIKEVEPPHKPNALDESDYHKLTRNEGIDKTIVESKKSQLDLGVEQANGEQWDEAGPFYKAKYPHNKVTSTHTGITVEIDDTNDEGRIHIYHPSNTYIEINPNGTIVFRNNSDRYDITLGNKHSHVIQNEHCNVEIDRTKQVGVDQYEWIGGNEYREVKENTHETVGGNTLRWVKENKHEAVNLNETRHVGLNLYETIGVIKSESIGMNDNKTVAGISSTLIGGENNETIVGLSSELLIGGKGYTCIGQEVNAKIGNVNETIIGEEIKTVIGQKSKTHIGVENKLQVGAKSNVTIGNVSFNIIGTTNVMGVMPISVMSSTMITCDAPLIALNSGLSIPAPPAGAPKVPTTPSMPSSPITPEIPEPPIPPK